MSTTGVISVLTEDEESDDCDDVQKVLALLHTHGKPMKNVGKRVLQVGTLSVDNFQRVIEEEEKEALAMKMATGVYNGTMDGLHAKYACEIRAREDALATTIAQKQHESKAALVEIKRLKDIIVQQQNEAAEQLAKVQADAVAMKKAALAREVVREAEMKKSKVEVTRVQAKDSLEMIIADVLQSYKDKLNAWTSQQAQPTVAPPIPPATQLVSPVAVMWIMQKNTNPTYLTVRELKYVNATKKWCFDSSDKRNDPTAQANWIEITDTGATTALNSLGKFTDIRKHFKPTIGSKTTYTFGQHTYEVEVVRAVKPWEAVSFQNSLSTQAATVAPVPSSTPNKHMLVEGPFFRPSNQRVKAYGDNLDTLSEMSEVIGHKQLTELATYWSSFSQGFKYDETKTELWVKPKWLSTWLNTLKYNDHEIRVVGHGVRKGDFSNLAKDPRGFNLAFCAQGRARGDGSHGFGIYVSPFDAIPADYTNFSGGSNGDGTFVLGLLQVPKPTTTFHPTSTSSSASYQTANGSLEFYHLGSSRQNYIANSSVTNDAYNVRDQTLFLTLGKVCT